MQEMKMQDSNVTRLGRREERWRLPLLALFLLLLGVFLVTATKRPPLNGKVDAVSHVASKQKAEDLKTKAEVDKRFKEGVMMMHAKEYEHALTAFHRVLQLAPQMPEAHVNAGFALLGMGQPKFARDFFESATNLRPNQLNAYFGLAEALTALGDDFGAMQAMETYVHLAPKDDPFRRKAESAAWELRAKLEAEQAKAPPPGQPGTQGAQTGEKK